MSNEQVWVAKKFIPCLRGYLVKIEDFHLGTLKLGPSVKLSNISVSFRNGGPPGRK